MKYLAPGLNKLSRRTNFCGISSKNLLSIPTIQFVLIKRHAKIDIKKWRRMWRMLQEVTAVRRRVLSYRMGRKKKKYIFPLIGEHWAVVPTCEPQLVEIVATYMLPYFLQVSLSSRWQEHVLFTKNSIFFTPYLLSLMQVPNILHINSKGSVINIPWPR